MKELVGSGLSTSPRMRSCAWATHRGLRLLAVAGAVSAAHVMTGEGSARAQALEPCTPAQLRPDAAEVPRAWRDALDALVAATGREGQPWSCTGARIALVPPTDERPALLEVEDGFGMRRRAVLHPSDLVPLGEAMLATTVPLPFAHRWGPPPSPELPARRVQRPPVGAPFDGPETSGSPSDPPGAHVERAGDPSATGSHARLAFEGLVGARYTGPTRALLIGPEARATYTFGAWSAGLVARYDAAVAMFQRVPDQFSLASVTVGLAGGYRLLKKPIQLVASVEPTLAVVLMGAQRPGEAEPDVDAHVDMRLGARLAAAIPMHGRLRAVCALGAEGAPAALFTDRDSRRHALPELPGYLAGVSVGLELGASP